MDRVRVGIRPGGMVADVTENELGEHQHVEVVNLKEVKVNEWETVKGYIDSYDGHTQINNGIEVTDDLSGDRFLLYLAGYYLRRLDYDAVNSPLTGYENETHQDLTLPDGISFALDADVRFFVDKGIVRITGGTEPLWYGYVRRKMLYTGYVEIDKFLFEAGSQETNFIGSNATVAADATWGQKGSTNSMRITVTGAGGYAYRQFTAYTKGKYRLFCQASKNDSGASTEEWWIYVGTSAGAGDILKTQHRAFNKVSAQYCIFEFDVPNDWDNATTTIYISIYPQTDGGSGDHLNVDNWLLHGSYPQIIIQNWKLEKAALNKFDLLDGQIAQAWASDEQDGNSRNVYCKLAAVYDGGQYSLMNIPAVTKNVTNTPSHLLLETYPKIGIKIDLLLTDDIFNNERITGVLVILGTVLAPLVESDPSMVWSVVEALDFKTHPPDIEFTHDKVKYETGTPYRLLLRDNAAGAEYHTHWEDGYFQEGAYVYLRRGGIQWISKITDVQISDAGNEDWIEIEDPIYPYLVDPDANFTADDMWIKISRLYKDVTGGYETNIGAENDGGTPFWTYTSIPNGTIHNTPNYSHHRVINNIGFALSLEDDEQDVIRYSPEFQPDNLSVLQIIATPVGDIDRNLALVERDGRFVTLKRNSISQGQFTSSQYYHDKDGKRHGLYATEGYIVIDDILYFMDSDDIYIFNGVQVEPFMQNSFMRSAYVANVSEDSFFAYKPLDKELWMVLNGIIIVYDFERRKFYLRETDLSPLFAITDYNQRLFLAEAEKFVLYDHDQQNYDESIQASFKTRIIDLTTPENFKRLHKILVRMNSNADWKVTASDPKEAADVQSQFTPYSDVDDYGDPIIQAITLKASYLFKEVYLKVETVAATANLRAFIKSTDLIVDRWKGIK